ncbi:MAG: type 4a pilus biogenesis protein PilO [Acidimicrobiales bacterium]
MNSEILTVVRQRKVALSIAVGLLVLFIWLLAVFNPEGHKLAAANASVQSAQTQQTQLETRLTQLKEYSKQSPTFEALSQRLSAAVPSTTDIYDYITAISNIASATDVSVQSVDPTTPVSSGNVAIVPVTISATGTYDQILGFVKALYALPRLTVITEVDLSGGGSNTNRSTALTVQLTTDILAQTSALAGQPGTQ